MATLYERMQAAWATREANALDYEAERMARQGIAESDIYAALEQLLLALREAGLDEEADDRINDVMDRVTGWCHPDHHIRTTRSALPTEEEIAKLPRWARVAFAARCARRVLPLFSLNWPDAPQSYGAQLAWAVEISERSAALSGAGEDWAPPAGAVTCLAYVCDAVLNAALNRARAVEVIVAIGIAINKFKDRAEDIFDPHLSTVVAIITHNSSVALANGIATSRETYDPALIVADAILRRDFDHLADLSDRGRWADETPVPPDVFGPLWPEGAPEGWPVASVSAAFAAWKPVVSERVPKVWPTLTPAEA